MYCFYLNYYRCTNLFYFSEKCIKSSCLNTAQNLISDINAQNENFVTLGKRLVELRKENSSDATQYGNFLYN